jgi:uncharacterized phage protein (TIGR01671 family)
MRDIEFRGKRKDNGDWIYGFVKISPNTGRVFISVCEKDKRGDNWLVYEVIPETVGQYINLKDGKGNKIFEDDILAVMNYMGVSKHLVEDIFETAIWYDWEIVRNNASLEIIGNVHDSPELLKEEE